MSSEARAHLFMLISRVASDGDVPWCDAAREHLDAYRAEVLREAAQRQRDAAHIVRLVDMDVEQAVRVSADLIDPDKS